MSGEAAAAAPLALQRSSTAPVAARSAGAYRVAGRGRVDPASALTFAFDGTSFAGLAGDTVASALLAHGVHLMGRSFKYHRPRGLVGAGSEEPNALISVHRGPGRFTPNTRATVQELYDGLVAESQNRWPSLRHDAGVVNDALSRFLSAGFYYKTFMWPKSFWRTVYEPAIRAAAGLGKPPTEPDADGYSGRYLHTDVLVVGGGPAGLAAALAAGRSGARVTVVDEGPEFGGSLLSQPFVGIDGAPAWQALAAMVDELSTLANVRLLPRTTAFGVFHQNMVALAQRVTDHLGTPPVGAPRERLWRVRANRVVLAQGAIEKPLVFPGNDRPAVMLAGAAATMLHRYGVLVGARPAVVTTHDGAWHTAFDLADAGARVAAIVDIRPTVSPALADEAARRGIATRLGHTVAGTSGRLRVSALDVAVPGRPGTDRIACDALLMSGGWTPSVHLFSHAKGGLVWTADKQVFLPGAAPDGVAVVGAGAGAWGIADAFSDGARAGAAAATDAGFAAEAPRIAVEADRAEDGVIVSALPKADRSRGKAFVDFQNDVTAKDIRLAVAEGFRSIEHVKRYTTTGMATDQGKTSNINGLLLAADALGAPPPAVGLTTFRPPFTPTTFGTIAAHRRGATFEVVRKTPVDEWAAANGAVFEPVALWRRARYFPEEGETMARAVRRECTATRQRAGLFDASTLGKIEVVGPDAAEFLDRMYTNPLKRLAVGRCRYSLLLGEDGFIRDDGIVARLAEDRFHVTTTTGGAAGVLNTMEDYRQTEWPDLAVWLTSITEQYATVAINGPDARRILAPLVEGLDVSGEAFPHMSVATCRVAGFAARLFRVSFTGELGFEVNVPARHGLALWQALLEAGGAGITPYGTETMHALRADKGYIIVGQDTDGTVTPYDAGLSWAIGKKKADFVGKRSLARPDMAAPGRRELVGLLTTDPTVLLEEGAQIVAAPGPIPMPMIGHVTSAYDSVAMGRSIALALVEDGRTRMGETVAIPLDDIVHEATIVAPQFYDPKGSRLDG